MTASARDYLIDRFRGDAQALRERVSALQGGAKIPGPDAATSRRMAEACAEVVTMLDSLAATEDGEAELASIVSLVPVLERRAAANASAPPVRAVYAGAATRIREVQAAEAQAAEAQAAAATGMPGNAPSDDDLDTAGDTADEDDDA